ncbi:pappalysin-2 isoform X2 [Danio rerio]|uniref:Pappalysin-2 isoform X2 n=2 Tax=Danio rerio TaxID=7955 RepID=A0A8M3B0D2_DANRE|nr:pappalysin-2 isoform X2 [Danio rerio]|eukprot:XP_009296921.1 pappalysin-2 isoform X2 [Danio rerio]
MMFFRLLAIILAVFHTWPLNSAQSDHIQKYKRTLAQRAERALAGEQCGSVSRKRPPRSTAHHYPLAGVSGRYTRLTDLHLRKTHTVRSCAGDCSSSAVELTNWDANEKETFVQPQEETFIWKKEGKRAQWVTDPASAKSLNPSKRISKGLPLQTEQGADFIDSLSKTRRVARSISEFNNEEVIPEKSYNHHTEYSTENEEYSGEQEGLQSTAGELWKAEVRDVPTKWMTGIYFSGQAEQLKVNPAFAIELPRSRFTIELWVKPEGGQNNPSIIAGVFDNCSHPLSEKGWSVGIQAADPTGRKDGRFFFSLRTDRSLKSTTIIGHQRYQPDSWTHVVASYDGHKMALYVDNFKAGESSEQSGDLYSSYIKACRLFLLGGDQSDHEHSFRGHLGGVALWGYARSHEELLKSHQPHSERQSPLLSQWADFSEVENQWVPYKDRHNPVIVALPVPELQLVSPFLPPPCGVTVCDNFDIALSYNKHWQMRAEKKIRYRVVNICKDNGSDPSVSLQQIQRQHQALEDAFHPYNITLELSIHTVYNSSLQRRFILSNCHIAKVGNRHCDPECDHPLTGHDGGDCLRMGPCYNWKRRDGVCNPECNSIHYDYDDGDCCDPEVTDVAKTCFDPESPQRAYLSVKELKELLHLSSSDMLNVFFANNSAREELAGVATWPWAKEALTHQGGMILNPAYFGTKGHNNTMIHEMGHIFGLYHVFKGVSERESCDDPCQETTASMETGDLCADTAPTPKSKACHDPDPVNDTCGLTQYKNTPYNNYMSYTDDDCTNHFTPNQVARMHCYIDLVYKTWVHERKPTPVPLAPVVVGQKADSVSIHWLNPISGPLAHREGDMNCQLCDENGALHQYAHEATSPHACDSTGYWTPEEAVGAPDVYQPCEPSMQAWSPEVNLYEPNMTTPCPQSEGCVLELHFLQPVLPDSLTVWITYTSANQKAIANIVFITENGELIHTGPQHAFCDIPLTLHVHTSKKVKAIKISTFDKKLEIDAVLLTSRPQNPLCSGCRPLLYRVIREPPIREDQSPAIVRQPSYTDSDVQKDVQYLYRIQVESDGLFSELSPSLLYTHGEHFCGDATLQGTEDCDDGNLLDGDGCSKKCHVEAGFKCHGQPSLCYVFEGDGVCEEFEKGSSIQDCGFFTPQGFNDQWASTALGSHQDQRCPASRVTGEPALTQMCKSQYFDINEIVAHEAWSPCTAHYTQDQSVWLQVGFERPGVAASVIIYLAYDGSWHGENCKKTVTIELCDTNGKRHLLGSYEVSCQRNPLVVNVTHNLSVPFYQTSAVQLNFSSSQVAVVAVALRTSCHFSAFALTGCVRRLCSTESCSPVNIEHASVRCTPALDSKHCSVSCHRGFILTVLHGQSLSSHQEAELICVHGVWDRVVSCQPVDCGPPPPSHVYFASFSCPWGTTFGKQCTFSCNAPAILQGESDTLVCLEDGLWSYPEAYCKIECADPPFLPNATLLVPHCQGGGHDVGTVCRFKCNPGYYVTGTLNKKPRKKFLRLECLEGGTWQEGSCSPVTCPPLRPMFEGMYSCTNNFDFDSVCTLQCSDPTEKPSIRCTKDGRWTEDFTMCKKIVGSCQAPPEVNLVEYSCDEGFDVGAACYPTCIVPLSDPVVLANGSSADTVEHWMVPTKVQSIVCTGMLKWYPNPEQIHCIQSCEPFGGDGWCDTINNRAYCQYDGGDCCPSTLSSGKVIQFGVDCDQDECTCRDPEAGENKPKEKQQPGAP